MVQWNKTRWSTDSVMKYCARCLGDNGQPYTHQPCSQAAYSLVGDRSILRSSSDEMHHYKVRINGGCANLSFGLILEEWEEREYIACAKAQRQHIHDAFKGRKSGMRWGYGDRHKPAWGQQKDLCLHPKYKQKSSTCFQKGRSVTISERHL